MTEEIIVSKQKTEIIVLDKKMEITPAEVFTEKGMDSLLEGIKKVKDTFKGDVTTKKGRAEIKSIAHKMSKLKFELDGYGKELTEDIAKQKKIIDTERKKARDTFDEWRDEIRKPVTEFEKREEKRIADCQNRIAEIEAFKSMRDVSVDQFTEAGKKVAELLNYDWNEFNFKACGIANETTLYLEEEKAKVIKQEKDEAELEKFREKEKQREEEEQKRLAKEKEERIAKEAADKAKEEAEKKALEEKEKVAQKQKKKDDAAIKEKERNKKEVKEAKEREDKMKVDNQALEDETRETQRKLKEAREEAKKSAEETKKAEKEKEKLQKEEAFRKKVMDESVKRRKNKEHHKKIHNGIIEDLTAIKSKFVPDMD